MVIILICKNYLPVSEFITYRKIGLVGEKRATSLKPALRNAPGRPVKTKTSGALSPFGATG
jgi:hypothetical protein